MEIKREVEVVGDTSGVSVEMGQVRSLEEEAEDQVSAANHAYRLFILLRRAVPTDLPIFSSITNSNRNYHHHNKT